MADDPIQSPRPRRAGRPGAHRPGRWIAGAWLAGLLALAGPAAAQDRPGAPPAAGHKFAEPATPPPLGGTDKFGLPRTGEAPAATPPPPAAAQAPPTPPPPDEPEAIRTLRRLVGPDTALRYAAAEVTDPASGAVRLREVVLERADGRMAIATLDLDGLTGTGVAEATARDVVVTDPDDPAGALRIDSLRIARLALRAPGQAPTPDAVSLGALHIEGLSLEGEGAVAIATLSLEDYGTGRPARVALEGLELRRPGGGGPGGPVERVSLGRLALRGLDLAATAAALAGEAPPPRPEGAWSLEAEALSLGGAERRLGGLEALQMTGEAPPGGAAETGRLTLRGIQVEPFPGLDAWLQRFGYAALIGDLTAETRYDRAAGRLEVTALSLAGRDIGALGLTLVLDGVTMEALEARDLDSPRLVAFGLRYLDQSLYGRYVRQEAQRTRQTEPQIRQRLAQQAGAALAVPGRDPGAAAIAPIRAAIQRFLRGEAREIEITARPPEPVPLLDMTGLLGGPVEAQRLLGLSATAR